MKALYRYFRFQFGGLKDFSQVLVRSKKNLGEIGALDEKSFERTFIGCFSSVREITEPEYAALLSANPETEMKKILAKAKRNIKRDGYLLLSQSAIDMANKITLSQK